MGVVDERKTVKKRTGAAEWAIELRGHLAAAAPIDEDTAAGVGVHLADLREAAGRLYRMIKRIVEIPAEDAERIEDLLIELQIEAEHARYHINEVLPVLEAVIEALPVEDDEEE